MFDRSWIDGLSAGEAADELAGVRDLVLAAEATQFALAAHWADLHAPEVVTDQLSTLPGMPRAVSAGLSEDCPEMDEYAAAELAALVGRSTVGGVELIRDAVTVRHRHPGLWSAIERGTVRVWVAAQVARRCARAGLHAGQALGVDEQTTPYVTTLPTGRFLELVDAKIIEADPCAAEERARARALARFVRAGRADEDGLRTLVARASAGDVTYLVAVLDRIAGILAEGGDHRPVEVLRADALRILGNPARALGLLTGASLDRLDPEREHADELAHETLFPNGDGGLLRDASTGYPLPGAVRDLADLDDRPLTEDDQHQLRAAGAVVGAVVGAVADVEGQGGCAHGEPAPEDHADPHLLTAVAEALRGFDASTLDPVVVLHAHVSEDVLSVRRGAVRTEGLGPLTFGELSNWLLDPYAAHVLRTRVQVRPVLDADSVRPVDRYEWPSTMSELASIRQPYEVFPYGTLRSRRADDDHADRYQSPARGGPPGQTRLGNNAKLARFHHRLKTNGGWQLRHPAPAVYLWRTPHGHWFRVDPSGSHHLGRDPALEGAPEVTRGDRRGRHRRPAGPGC